MRRIQEERSRASATLREIGIGSVSLSVNGGRRGPLGAASTIAPALGEGLRGPAGQPDADRLNDTV